MDAQDYPITPPGKIATLFPTLIGAACLAMLVLVLAIAKAPLEQGLHAWPVLPCVLVLPLVSWHMGHRSVRLGDDGLRVRRFPWPRTLSMASIDLAKAEVVDLHKRPELTPAFKAAGSRVPGYRSGRFRLRDGRWAQLPLNSRSMAGRRRSRAVAVAARKLAACSSPGRQRVK